MGSWHTSVQNAGIWSGLEMTKTMVILLLPPVMAVMIVPEDGNYWTHLIEYLIGFFAAIFGIYSLRDKEDKDG